MNDENSLTAGTKPRIALRIFDTNVQTKRTVVRMVPTSDSKAAFLSVIVGV